MVQMHAVNTSNQVGTRKGNGGMSYGRIVGGIAFITFLIVLVIAVNSGSDASSSKKKEEQKMEPFVSGRVKQVGETAEGVEGSFAIGEPAHGGVAEEEPPPEEVNESPAYDEEAVSVALGEAEVEIEEEEVEDEEKEELLLNSKFLEVKSHIADDIVQLAGDKMSAKDVSDIEKQIVEDIQSESLDELKVSAQDIAELQIQGIESETHSDEDYGMDTEYITDEMDVNKDIAKIKMGEDLHQEALRIASTMQQRAVNMEKDILEKRLSARLGKTVHLTIEDDEVKDIDHLFDDLPALSGNINFSPPGNFGAPPANLRGNYLPNNSNLATTNQQVEQFPQAQQQQYIPQAQQYGGGKAGDGGW